MKSILATATALTMLCGAAIAQTSTSGSNSNANANTTSRSNSVSNPSVNVYGNPIGNGSSSSNSSANARTNSRSRSNASSGQSSSASGVTINAISPLATTDGTGSSSSTQTIRNTPEIIAPSIVGGNPCTVGVSGGIALPGFGIVSGGSWEGKACERRQLAALLYNMGHDITGTRGESLQDAAIEVLCVDQDVRSALKRIGQPCVADRATAVAAAAPIASATTAVASPVAAVGLTSAKVASAATTRTATAKQLPEWCYTASAAERRAHKACDGRT